MQVEQLTYRVREVAGLQRAVVNWRLMARAPEPRKGYSSAQQAGLRYERKALKLLYREVPGFIDHPIFDFKTRHRGELLCGRAIPDGIVVDARRQLVTVYEIKLRHTERAWSQLGDFYLPIVLRAFPGLRVNLVEVCKWYDPDVRLAPAVELLSSPGEEASRGVFIWSGR